MNFGHNLFLTMNKKIVLKDFTVKMLYDIIFSISLTLYLPVVFILKKAVSQLSSEHKKHLCDKLEPYNVAWNTALSIFSAIGSYKCYRHFAETGYTCGFIENPIWIDLFCYSKIVEFIDTIFIVLRSKPLVLLQWYHHFVTCLLCWRVMKYYPREILLGAYVNYTIHAFMYGYYALYSLGFKSIRHYGFILTIAQTAQMVVGLHSLYVSDLKSCFESVETEISMEYMQIAGAIMFLSYFVLFSKLLVEKITEKPKIR
jgi:elongation of very long chain fatty acids protein 6